MCTGGELAIAGGVAKGLGAYQAGEAQKDLYDNNAAFARERGKDALVVAGVDIHRYGESVAKLIGSQRSGYAAQGVSLDAGSPVDIVADTKRIANIDEQMLYLNAIRQKWGFDMQADDFDRRAAQAHQAGIAGAIGSVLGGGAQAYGYAELKTFDPNTSGTP